MGKLIVYMIGALLGLTACSEGVAYQVEGKLSNLTEPTIYAVFESESKEMGGYTRVRNWMARLS